MSETHVPWFDSWLRLMALFDCSKSRLFYCWILKAFLALSERGVAAGARSEKWDGFGSSDFLCCPSYGALRSFESIPAAF